MMIKTDHPAPNCPLKLENTDKAPRIRAKDARPKANEGRPGKMFDTNTNVIGMVMLKRNIPVMAKNGTLAPKTKRGIDSTNDPTPMRIQPNLSANIPPRLLPKNTATVNITSRLISDFQGNTRTEPTNDLTATDVRISTKINPK